MKYEYEKSKSLIYINHNKKDQNRIQTPINLKWIKNYMMNSATISGLKY